MLKRLRPKPPVASAFRVPAGERVYAVGDIHGCARELDQLLSAIESDSSGSDLKVHLIFLGDLIDRGPESAQVVDRLCRRDVPGDRHSFLMGNHEEVMLNVIDGKVEQLPGWLRYGGAQTLESYGISREEILRLGLDLPQRIRDAVPEAHLRFLRTFVDSLQIGDFLFVHAGIRPGVALDDQKPEDLRWVRNGFLDDDTDHGLIVVHGHTITNEPEIRENRIGVDTGCYQSGVLTALVLEGTERRFVSNSVPALQSVVPE